MLIRLPRQERIWNRLVLLRAKKLGLSAEDLSLSSVDLKIKAKKGFKALAMKYHPDRYKQRYSNDLRASRPFRQALRAYEFFQNYEPQDWEREEKLLTLDRTMDFYDDWTKVR